MTTTRSAAAAIALAIALLALAAPAGADDDADLDRRARQLCMELMSPFCPGQSLYVCRSSQAAVVREEIRERLAAGESSEAIVESLVARYGESIRGAPRNRGFGRLAWLTPILGLALGGWIVVLVLRSHRRARGPAPGAADGVDSEARRRLEQELDHYAR
jgi:cytochrome c-type biogenesis protein CcmH/NrfF